MTKCIVMFSGGLDSTIAVHLLKRLGLDVLALYFVLPFYSGLGLDHAGIKKRAEALGVPLRIEEEGGEYLAMFKTRQYGFGKNVNPCLDCRIHRLEKAGRIMAEVGASFIVTGEVVGQRPMSQRRDCLDIIEKKSGLRGLILRPLSARLLNPTIPEKQGWVPREQLMDWGGRGRKRQIAYAAQFGLSYPAPAGGCLLTMARSAERYNDLASHSPEFTLNDFKLLAYGRHFRLGPSVKLVMGRDDADNGFLVKLTLPEDTTLVMKDVLGPYGIVRGNASDDEVRLACSIFCKYSRLRDAETAQVTVTRNSVTSEMLVIPATEEECERKRV
jgi:tRNA U34 2-thiouridine synthase MnmA/TrmU